MGNKKQINKKGKTSSDHLKDDEENGDVITKKIFINESSSSKTTTKSAQDQKNQKQISKEKQFKISSNLENANIQSHIIEQFKKFDPPECRRCNNRKADRICVNKKCVKDNSYMQLICGKCHSDIHQQHVQKLEIDVEEYFIKLGMFINNQQYDIKYKPIVVDIGKLQQILKCISELRQKLTILKLDIQNQIIESDKNIYEIVPDCAIRALSNCEYGNINQQLLNIKQCLSFSSNKFQWNDNSQKLKYFLKSVSGFNDKITQIQSHIAQSYQQEGILEFINTKYQGQQDNIKVIDNKIITISQTPQNNPQVVDQTPLDRNLKYLLRVEISTINTYYPIIGLIRQACQDTQHIYQENLCFYSMTKVIKGTNLYDVQPKVIEMYISISENKLLISDYPNHTSINTLLQTNNHLQEYSNLVIGFSKASQDEIIYKIQDFSIVGEEPIW